MKNTTNFDTQKLVMGALLTALVIVFQLTATYTSFFGPLKTAMGLIPISLGAILCGPVISTWLGFIFAIVILATGGAEPFIAIDFIGTIIVVLSKGTLCGLIAGLVYRVLSKWKFSIATIISSVICPIVNTGVFLIGCYVFFMDDATKMAKALGSPESGMVLFVSVAFANFIFEIGANVILSPVIARLLKYRLND